MPLTKDDASLVATRHVPGWPGWVVSCFAELEDGFPSLLVAHLLMDVEVSLVRGRPFMVAVWCAVASDGRPEPGWSNLEGVHFPGPAEALAAEDGAKGVPSGLLRAAGSLLSDPASVLLSLEVMTS